MWRLSASDDELCDCTRALLESLHGRVSRIRQIDWWARTLEIPFPRQHFEILKDAEYFQKNPEAPPFEFHKIRYYNCNAAACAREAMQRSVHDLLVDIKCWYIAEARIAFGGDERDICAESMFAQALLWNGVPAHAARMWICRYE